MDASRYAGGYSGYTRAADVASLGNIDLLGGLLNLSELLSLGQVVVPTQRNTGVTGPLRNVTKAQMDTSISKTPTRGQISPSITATPWATTEQKPPVGTAAS